MNKNIFNSVQLSNPPSNWFDLGHDVKLSLRMGYLYPIMNMDCLPGDQVNISYESMLRFSALIAPVMHRVKVTQHYFFVPNRILWSNWESFITQESDLEHPYVSPFQGGATLTNFQTSLADYMGVPTFDVPIGDVVTVPRFNAFPFAAFYRICAEYYADQNLQEDYIKSYKAWSTLVDGDNSNNEDPEVELPFYTMIFQGADSGNLPRRAWQHDYFTSCLPFAQKGDIVELPIGDFNDVEVFTNANAVPGPATPGGKFRDSTNALFVPGANTILYSDASTAGSLTDNNASTPLYYDPNGSMFAETSALTAGTATINNLRRAFRLQEWLERNARGGTRYFESLLSHFGVRSPDARLQRPEYIGGSVQNMVISEVLSTAQTLDGEGAVVNPVGQMSGHGISVGGSKVLSYYCQEHGWIIGILNVQPLTAYQQGIPRRFSRTDIFDYAFPTFAHIGEQEVLNKEVYFDPEDDQATNDATFGYVPRYAEYRYENNRVAGEFRSTLNFWHLGRIFDGRPLLNADFINCEPSTRIFAVETGDHIYAHILFKIKAKRKLPMFGTPSF